jgi:REase_AHJR-like
MSLLHTNDLRILNDFRSHYEAQGMKFIVEPKTEQLPDFLRNDLPSAIALRDVGGVVLQVRHIGPAIEEIEKLKILSNKLKDHKDWSLDVVLASSDKSYLLPSANQVKLESNSVRIEISKHKNGLSSIGSTTYLLLYSWSLFEAIARRAIFEEGLADIRDHLSSNILVENLLEADLIEDFEAAKIVEIMQVKNLVAHGFVNKEVEMSDVDFLIDIIDRLSTSQLALAS